MTTKTKKLCFAILIFAAFVALLVVAGFFDLQISKSLVVLKEGEYYSNNFFVAFFDHGKRGKHGNKTKRNKK